MIEKILKENYLKLIPDNIRDDIIRIFSNKGVTLDCEITKQDLLDILKHNNIQLSDIKSLHGYKGFSLYNSKLKLTIYTVIMDLLYSDNILLGIIIYPKINNQGKIIQNVTPIKYEYNTLVSNLRLVHTMDILTGNIPEEWDKDYIYWTLSSDKLKQIYDGI